MTGNGPKITDGAHDGRKTVPAQTRISISVFLGLLIVSVFVMPSIGFGEHHLLRYTNIACLILFTAGISVARRQRRLFLLTALIAVVAIAVRFHAMWNPSRFWELSSEIATIAAILMISWILLLGIFRPNRAVTPVSIQAAIAVYLLFGLAWANAYLIVMQLHPDSFQSTVPLSSSNVNEWFYYSFVTLTTLGYGEITPVSQVARGLAVGEAVTGQLYLAVLIARLIGREISSSQTADPDSL